MTEQLEPVGMAPAPTTQPAAANHARSSVAEDLLPVIQGVGGVAAVYQAQPLWQSIAGAAIAAVTGESLPLVAVTEGAENVAVKVRIGVDTALPAPKVAREVADAIRKHLFPRPAAVEVYVVKLGQ